MKKLVGRFKVYISRATGWVGIINMTLLVGNFKLLYNIPVPFWVIVPAGALGILALGYADYKLFLLAENEYNNKQNDIKIQLNRIEANLK